MRRGGAALLVAVLLAAGAVAASAATTVTLDRGRHSYRGSGSRGLGTLRLKHGARLAWRHTRGGRLVLTTSAGHGARFPLLTTTSRDGALRLRAGIYRGMRVATAGRWRLSITTPRHP